MPDDLLAGLEGEARAERQALIDDLLADGFTPDELREAAAAGRLALLPVERVLRRDDARWSARQVAEQAGVELEVLRRLWRALGLADAGDDEVYALGLVYGDGQDELEPAALHLAREAGRAAAQASGQPWNVNEWDGPELELDPWPSDDDAFMLAGERLAETLEEHGVNPVRWVLARVARELMSRPLPLTTTPDFVALPIDLAAPENVDGDLAFVAPWAAPPPGRGQLAHVQENLDAEDPRWLGTFECLLEAEDVEGPESAPLEEALAWAEARAEKVLLTVGDTAYSAGRVPIAGLPEWPKGRRVTPRPL